VVPGRRADYQAAHPTRAVLVVEVADSSLRFDRDEKGSLYARARVPEYWIVNLVAHLVEVYRDPVPDVSAPYGWRYASVSRLGPGSMVEPVAFRSARIRIADLRP
jgi:Uma2 family endonuclease